HPDCLYFQMHTCSRPCNNDIDRRGYLIDVAEAEDFIQGRDQQIEDALTARMNTLADDMNFEEAEVVRRRLERIRKARSELKASFRSVSSFDAIVLLPSDSVTRCKIAYVKQGAIAGFEEYAVDSLVESLPSDIERFLNKPLEIESREWQYDEFCLVANF